MASPASTVPDRPDRLASDEELRTLPFSLRRAFFLRRPTIQFLLDEYGHRMPASPETFNSLPGSLRRSYRGRPLTELAARCLLAEALKNWTGVRTTQSVYPLRKRPQAVRRDGLFMQQNERRTQWLTKAG